jgi:outer membrane protein OmpA-like peptidoglycan-associated protein
LAPQLKTSKCTEKVTLKIVMFFLRIAILLVFQVLCSELLLAQNTTVINHFPKDTTGKSGALVPTRTAEHRIVINYYEPADVKQLDQFQDLVSSYLNLYIDRCALLDNGNVKLKNSKKQTMHDLNNIVIGALDFYDYEKLKDFKGFSKMVENKLASIDALDFSKTDFANGAKDEESKSRMEKFYLQKELSDLKLLVNMEVGIYGDDNLMVISSSDETVIDEAARQRLIDEYTSFDPKRPLEPIKVKLSDESLALINFEDTSSLSANGLPQDGKPKNDKDFAEQVLRLLEANNSKLDGMQKQIDDLRTEQLKLWQQQQDDKNLVLQNQIDDLREMVFALVKMNTGEAVASSGNGMLKPGSGEGTVSNLPKQMNVYFAKGSSKLDASSQLSLNEIVDILARSPSIKLIVTGYADKTGDAAKNLLLSQNRANEVKKFLALSGLPQDRFITKYFGDRDSQTESSDDRRVAIEFVR